MRILLSGSLIFEFLHVCFLALKSIFLLVNNIKKKTPPSEHRPDGLLDDLSTERDIFEFLGNEEEEGEMIWRPGGQKVLCVNIRVTADGAPTKYSHPNTVEVCCFVPEPFTSKKVAILTIGDK